MAEQSTVTGGVSGLKESVAGSPAAGRLKEAAAAYAAAQAQRLLISTGRKLGETTARLNDVAENGGSPSGSMGAALKETVGSTLKDTVRGSMKSTVKNAVKAPFQKIGESLSGKRKGGGGQGKFLTIIEDTDVGVPVREAYNQWTQYQEFSTFTKGVQGVETTDDTSSNWRAKVLWSTRSWKANTTEQIPDERIAWTSEGAKGTVKGVVTFHALGENLTRVLLVIEYYPKGLFEKTGNIWRAQGRRARLDLKHFRRFVMMRGEATGEWRGEIRDGEVVRSHEDALDAESRDEEPEETSFDEPEDEPDEDEPEDEYEEDEPEEDEPEYEERAEDEYEEDELEYPEEYAAEDEPEREPAR